jgi:hypothetical protein
MVGAAALAFGAQRLARNVGSSRGARIVTALLQGASASAVCFAVGAGIVALAQLALDLGATRVMTDAKLFATELELVSLRQRLAFVFSIHLVWLLLLLASLMAVALWHPELGLLQRFARLQRAGRRILLVLATINVFTFFSAVELNRFVATHRARLHERLRTRMSDAQQRIMIARRQIAAAAIVCDSLEHLPKPQVKKLRALFKKAEKPPGQSWWVQKEAQRLAEAGPWSSAAASQASDVRGGQDDLADAPSTIRAIERAEAEAIGIEQAVAEARAAVNESVLHVAGAVTPEVLHEFVAPLLDTISEHASSTWQIVSVKDIRSAREWWKQRSSAIATAEPKPKWDWNLRAEPPPPPPSPPPPKLTLKEAAAERPRDRHLQQWVGERAREQRERPFGVGIYHPSFDPLSRRIYEPSWSHGFYRPPPVALPHEFFHPRFVP